MGCDYFGCYPNSQPSKSKSITLFGTRPRVNNASKQGKNASLPGEQNILPLPPLLLLGALHKTTLSRPNFLDKKFPRLQGL
jgi:hypothetical protein